MNEYVNKPVPKEAQDTGENFASESIFALELLRFLVNDEGIVTFSYEFEAPSADDE